MKSCFESDLGPLIMRHLHAQFKLAVLAICAAAMTILAPSAAMAQEETAEAAAPTEVAAEAAVEAPAAGSYERMTPTEGKGMPTAAEDDMLASMTFQDQYTEDGAYALGMHDYLLLPVAVIISIFVLGLLFYVILRFRKAANPNPSRTTHNTLIEVVWTVVPVLILVVIAVPSITLLARQYETPPEDAVTIKAVGYQWYWGYTYPDYGEFEVISNMKETADLLPGEVDQLEVDNRMVVPANTPLRIQTTAADVIHAFAVPSLWFKLDAVPGRLNEKLLIIEEPGVYYGQCSELCGPRHAYMPIAVEALPPEEFAEWVRAQGGTMPGEEEAAPDAEEATAEEAPSNEEASEDASE